MTNEEEVIMKYENILVNKAKNLSQFFVVPQYQKFRLTTVIKYVIEEKLHYTKEEALEKLTLEDLIHYKIRCVLNYIDKPDVYDADDMRYLVYSVYPELPQPSCKELTLTIYKEVLDETRKKFPNNFFTNHEFGEERARYCFQYLCEEVLKLTQEEIKETFSRSNGIPILSQYKLKIILNVLFTSNADLLQSCYPEIYKK